LYMKNKVEVNNPLIQLKRSESLLRQLLQSLGYHLPIVASVVFINPEFTLYHAPLHLPFIFPTQLNRYFRKLNNLQSKLSRKHKDLANQLFSLHCEEAPYRQLPSYDFDRLRKGITCAKCDSFSINVEGKNVNCQECGHEEGIAAAIMRNVEEFKFLFPDRKITTNSIYEWCKIIESKKKIKRVLDKNLKTVGARRWYHYQ
ncbi:NERD domain-containing protein, partial [Fictibacillus sp. Mic-4]|uniref:NERD domain-containing protein n=1 Tax=Fictibacillus sp. Mic-4 TaxID=3132826 RepID=UPI003CF3838B